MSLHLPQFDAPGLAIRGRVLGKPVVLTYHCDLRAAARAGSIGWSTGVVQFQNGTAGRWPTRIVVIPTLDAFTVFIALYRQSHRHPTASRGHGE
jgi:hypothetical protein